MDTYLWVREEGFNSHGIRGWRCIGGSPNNSHDSGYPTKNSFGKDIGKYTSYIRKGAASGATWEKTSQAFVKTNPSTSQYSEALKTRFRVMPTPASSVTYVLNDGTGDKVYEDGYYTNGDYVKFYRDPEVAEMYTMHAGQRIRIDPTTYINELDSTLEDKNWKNWNYLVYIAGINQGNVVRHPFFKTWLLNKYSLLGREEFDKWALPKMYGNGSNVFQKYLDLADHPPTLVKDLQANLEDTQLVFHGRGWNSKLPGARTFMKRIELGHYVANLALYSRMVRDSGLAIFSGDGMTGISLAKTVFGVKNEHVVFGGLASVLYICELASKLIGPGPVSIADNLLNPSEPLLWPPTDPASTEVRGEFWNSMASGLVPYFISDTSVSKFDGTAAVDNGYSLEIVDDKHSRFLEDDGTYSDSRRAGSNLIYRENFSAGRGPLQDLSLGNTTYAEMVDDLHTRGKSGTPHTSAVGHEPWRSVVIKPEEVGKIPPFQLRFDSSLSPAPQTLPTSRI